MNDRPAKRPSFQWYPGDAQRDTALRSCSLEARGLWREMMDLMHDGKPYGFLTAGDVPIVDAKLAALVGISSRKCTTLLVELEQRGVFSRTEEGVIYSRRMVRDEHKRNARAAGGGRSLENPNVPRPKDPDKDPPKDTFGPSFGGSPAVAVAFAVASSPSSSAREELLRLVPNRKAWELEFAAALDGMHGPKATDAQIDLACREYLGNGAADRPNLPHWRGHLRRVVEPPMPRPAEGPEVGGYVQKIRELIKQNPGRQNYLPKSEVAAMGPDVLRAYDEVGGADRFLALQAKDLPFLIRDFRIAMTRSSATGGRDRQLPENDR